MDKNQVIAIAGAFLVTTAGVVGVRAWADATATATLNTSAAKLEYIPTLSPIEVHPTREQLEQLGKLQRTSRTQSMDGGDSGGGVALDMPYYSFGAASRRASKN